MSSFLESLTRTADRLPSPSFPPDDFIELLKSADFDVRLQTLNRAVSIAKRDEDWFNRFPKKGELFKCLDRILLDERWELQHQCIKFLVEVMPTFGGSCEYCMCYVMPNLIPKLASSKITVRRICLQSILTFLRLKPEALGSVLKMTSNYVKTSRDELAKGEVLHEARGLFIPELTKGNWINLVDAITAAEVHDQKLDEKIAGTLKLFLEYIGIDAYEAMLETLPEENKKRAAELSHLFELSQERPGGLVARTSIKLQSGGERRLRFGIVPSVIATLISDDNNANARISGLEKLKQMMEQITGDDISRLVPHLHSYLLLLSHVLSDLNFKVVVLGLDVVRLTINRLKSHMEPHLQQVVSLMSKHFGNQKAVIKQLIMMTFMDLFQNVTPKSVAGALRIFLENRNSRVREEVVNILTSALMTTSPSKVNLSAATSALVPLLVDPKRRVRLAAFEQLSVVAYLLNGKLDNLHKTIREVEAEQSAKGLFEAVTARIRRQLLPRICYDGLIEYSIPPVSDKSFDVNESEMGSPENADLHWILNYSNNDPNDRTASPVSLAGNLAIIRQKRQLDQTMDRMKSDDAIIRRQNSAVSNPASSTNSWHSPKRVNSVVVDLKVKDNAPKAAANQVPSTNNWKEVNNNSEKLTTQKKLSRARSEGSVTEELGDEAENFPPSFDEKPVVASGQYSVAEYDTPSSGSLAKKSISHHSLPITHHPPLKTVQSQPQRKPQAFLKSAHNTPNNNKPTTKSIQHSAKSHSVGGESNFTVAAALKKIDSDEWSDKVDGLNMVTELSTTNPRQVSDNIKEVTAAVLKECKNLRSSVSRVALVTLGALVTNLKAKMDNELEKICVVLMNKAGDVSNAFIREDATDALQKLVKSASPHKVMQAIIAAGAKSKNNTIRASCGSFVNELVEMQGTSTVLGSPSILSHLLPALVQFSRDQAPQVRQPGRQTLCFLSQDPQFEKLIRKNAGEAELKTLKEILGHIEKKGGIEALDASSVSLSGSLSRVGSTRKVQKKLPDSLQLDLDEIRADLIANGWERRLSGLSRFEEMCSTANRAVASDTNLIEAFIARLSDINSKVALQAMDSFLHTLPLMNKLYSSEANLKALLNQLVLALMSHLPSKSEDHRHLAQSALQQAIKQIDAVILLPALSAAVRKANLKQKPFMTQIFSDLITFAYKSKPKQVEVVALPLLWEALKVVNQDADNKKAAVQLSRTLAKLMGEKAILDAATAELDPQRRKLFEALLR